MPRFARARRSSTNALLAFVALLLVTGAMWAGPPVAAHTFTKTDGNDSPGRLDLRSVSVSHTATGVVHRFQTYEAWSARNLGIDSFFIIQIDKDHKREANRYRYERCAFIYFASRLRGSLTNCGARFIRSLPVSKASGTVARITIPKSETGNVYWWAAASLWVGSAPCGGRGCLDYAPNFFPDILHDMVPPAVDMVTDPLRVWEPPTDSTTPDFGLPFSVSDANAGIKSWTVQSHAIGSGNWTFVISGTGAGAKEPVVNGAEGARLDYRVVAKDKQGNQTIGPVRRVYIPFDDDNFGSQGVFSVTPTLVDDGTAFGGKYSAMAATDSLTYTWTPPVNPADCVFELIGPGTGTWSITVTPLGGSLTPKTDADVPDLPRQVIYSDESCATSYLVVVTTGPFGLDAVLG